MINRSAKTYPGLKATWGFSVGILLLVLGCSATEAKPSGDLQTFTHQLDNQIPTWMQQYHVPGVAIALIRKGEVVWIKGYGLADQAQNLPVTENTVFQLASVSKALTAWGVMRLVENGQIDLDAPVEQYLTRWHFPPSEYDADAVTVRRLLSHTAGLSIIGYDGQMPDEPLPSLEASLAGNNTGGSAVYIRRPPGTEFRYSGGGYTVLQLLIEEVTGEPYAEYMQREILAPLGMNHSAFEWAADLHSGTAIGYATDGQPFPNFLFTEKAAAGLYSTAADMASFVSANMVGPHDEPPGRGVLTQETLGLMYTPVAQLSPLEALFSGTSYGLGHFIEILPDDSKLVGHTGGNWGWLVQFMYLPEHGEGIVVLTNSDNGLLFVADVVGAWGQWLGHGAPMVSRTLQTIYLTAWALTGLLGIGLFFKVRRFVGQIASGHRQWLWKLSPRPTLWGYLKIIFGLFASIIVAWNWWTIVYPLLLSFLVFSLGAGLTALVMGWCLYGFITTFLQLTKDQTGTPTIGAGQLMGRQNSRP